MHVHENSGVGWEMVPDHLKWMWWTQHAQVPLEMMNHQAKPCSASPAGNAPAAHSGCPEGLCSAANCPSLTPTAAKRTLERGSGQQRAAREGAAAHELSPGFPVAAKPRCGSTACCHCMIPTCSFGWDSAVGGKHQKHKVFRGGSGSTHTTFKRAQSSDPRFTHTKPAKTRALALLYKSDNLSWETDPTRKSWF